MEETDIRSQFTFYLSFYKAIARIKKKSDRADAYDTIVRYALMGEMPNMDSLPDAAAIALEVIMPNVDAARRKALGGKKGKPNSEDNEKISERQPKDNGKNGGTSPEQGESENKNKDKNKNKIKNKHKCEDNTPAPEKKAYGEFGNVLLTDEEYAKLKERFPRDYLAKIEKCSSYVASSGKKYASHYATILNWAREDQPQAVSAGASAPASDWAKNAVARMMQEGAEV